MARALSKDLRLRVLKAADDGASARQAAARFGIGVSSAIRWIAREEIGEHIPRAQGRRCGPSLDGYADFIIGIIEARTLNEMVERLDGRALDAHRPKRVKRPTAPHGWTFIKVYTCTGVGRPDILRRRRS